MHHRLWPLTLVLGAIGCSSGGSTTDPGVGPTGLVVGATCTKDAQCTYKCDNNTCTKACKSDLDCPGGTVCITSDSGKCAIVCVDNSSCTGVGGSTAGSAAYVCRAETKLDGTGKANVCREP